MANIPKYQQGGSVSPYTTSGVFTDTLKSHKWIDDILKRSRNIVSEDIEGKTVKAEEDVFNIERIMQDILAKKDKSGIKSIVDIADFVTNWFPAGKFVTAPAKMGLQVKHATGQQELAQNLLNNMLPGWAKGTKFEKDIYKPYERKTQLQLDEFARQSDLDFMDYTMGTGESWLQALLMQESLDKLDLFGGGGLPGTDVTQVPMRA